MGGRWDYSGEWPSQKGIFAINPGHSRSYEDVWNGQHEHNGSPALLIMKRKERLLRLVILVQEVIGHMVVGMEFSSNTLLLLLPILTLLMVLQLGIIICTVAKLC